MGATQISWNAMLLIRLAARGASVALASPGGQFIYTDIDFGKNINNAGNMVGVAYDADYTLSPWRLLGQPDEPGRRFERKF